MVTKRSGMEKHSSPCACILAHWNLRDFRDLTLNPTCVCGILKGRRKVKHTPPF